MNLKPVLHGMALAGLTLMAPLAAHAAAFTNGSFETVTGVPSGGFLNVPTGGNAISGWDVVSGSVDVVDGSFLVPDFVASDGVNSIDLNGSSVGTIAQTFDTILGNVYRVTFDLNANVYDSFIGLKNVRVSAGADTGVFSYDTALHPIGQGGPWQSNVFTFTALGSSSTLSFESLYTGTQFNGAELDNVAVGLAVPEPATWAMMIGGFGLAGASLRRRRAATAAA